MHMDDYGKYTVKVDDVEVDNLVQQRLVEAAQIIERFKDPEDVAVWNALMIVIPYFSNPDQIRDLANWNTDADWINIVAKHS
jgi:hypothetical protein